MTSPSRALDGSLEEGTGAPRDEQAAASPATGRPSLVARVRLLGRVGVAMMVHDRLKMIGTLLGVVFAVVLANQQAGTFLGLLYKNVMFVRNADAALWIAPPGTENLQGGKTISTAALDQALAARGVLWAEPLLFSGASIRLPAGGTQPVTLVGTRYPGYHGGPWNLVAGSKEALRYEGAMIFEDSDRETFGGLNLGSLREVNGRNVYAAGFTWGLEPFGPSYAFADFELARELLRTPRDQTNFVLVGLEEGADVRAVKAELARLVPEMRVLTKQEFEDSIVHKLVFESAIGITFGTSTLFGLVVGFVIVALSMFSAVVDNVREFGTLKAVGATNSDLAILLFAQSVLYAIVGSVVGLALVTRMVEGIRSAKLAIPLLPEMVFGTVVVMIAMCVLASSLALLRLRKVEPAMVFR